MMKRRRGKALPKAPAVPLLLLPSTSKRSRKSRSQRLKSTLEKVQEANKEKEPALEKEEEEPALEKAIGSVLEEDGRQESGPGAGGPSTALPGFGSRQKHSSSSKPLEKGWDKPLEKGKPRVVVDWHNTLEHADAVSGENSAALDLLL